jgi:type VI secretion system secreted protein Hcp
MAVDAFIYFIPAGGMLAVEGETKDLTYKKGGSVAPMGAFEIKDFSFGCENPTTIGSATGGAGAGKCKFNEFTIKKTTDSASPNFFRNCAAGAHYSRVVIDMRKGGGDVGSSGLKFLSFTFEVVFTTKIDWSGPGDEGPEESITFVYGTLIVEYLPQVHEGSDAGTMGNPVKKGWNQITNVAQDTPA